MALNSHRQWYVFREGHTYMQSSMSKKETINRGGRGLRPWHLTSINLVSAFLLHVLGAKGLADSLWSPSN